MTFCHHIRMTHVIVQISTTVKILYIVPFCNLSLMTPFMSPKCQICFLSSILPCIFSILYKWINTIYTFICLFFPWHKYFEILPCYVFFIFYWQVVFHCMRMFIHLLMG